MFKKVKEKLKGVGRFMDEKIQMAKTILSSDRNRLILGLIITGTGLGIGGGFIASALIKIPE